MVYNKVMNIIEFTGGGQLPSGVWYKHFDEMGGSVFGLGLRYTKDPSTLPNQYPVLRSTDDLTIITIEDECLHKGDLIVYDGGKREVVRQGSLVYKFLKEVVMPFLTKNKSEEYNAFSDKQ